MKSIYFLVLLFSYVFTSETDLMFEEFKIVPSVIDKAPGETLQIVYKNKKVELGNELTPTEVKDDPIVSWNADSNSYYTLLMVDPDAPSRQDPKFRDVRHWFVGNIKGSDVSKGEHITEYLGSGPPKGTGLHRYIFLLYKQDEKINYDDEPRTPSLSRDHRLNFNTKKFLEKYNLHNLIAGNFYQAQWDAFVDERNIKIAELAKNKQ